LRRKPFIHKTSIIYRFFAYNNILEKMNDSSIAILLRHFIFLQQHGAENIKAPDFLFILLQNRYAHSPALSIAKLAISSTYNALEK